MTSVLALLCSFFAALSPQDAAKKRVMKDRKWIEGKVVCIGCTLAGEYGVEAQCTLHARHAQGILDKEGKLWTLVDNARGHFLIGERKLRGKEIRVFGWTYEKHRYLEPWNYELRKEKKWIRYDYCRTCGFEPGDNQDRDLCPDCRGR